MSKPATHDLETRLYVLEQLVDPFTYFATVELLDELVERVNAGESEESIGASYAEVPADVREALDWLNLLAA